MPSNTIKLAAKLYKEGWRVENGNIILRFAKDAQIIAFYNGNNNIIRLIENLQKNGKKNVK